MSKDKTLLGYAHAWLVAGDQQATKAKENGIDGEVAGMMCVIALQNAVVGAARVLGNDHPAVEACLAEVGDLKDVRDMFTHFDAYVTGTGNLQKGEPGAEGFGWMPMWSSPEVITILNRPKGEELPTTYVVSIHRALKAVAVLVLAAAESLGITPSALLAKLTG